MTFTPTIYLKFKSEYLNAVKNNVIQLDLVKCARFQ